MKQLKIHQYKTTANRLTTLIHAAQSGQTEDLDKKSDDLVTMIKQGPNTAQNLTQIAHILNKYADGARDMPKGNPLKHIKQTFTTPALTKLLNDNTLDILKAVMPPKKIVVLPVGDISQAKPPLGGHSDGRVITLHETADIRPLYATAKI